MKLFKTIIMIILFTFFLLSTLLYLSNARLATGPTIEVISKTGGVVTSVDVAGNYAYVGFGKRRW